MSSLCFQVREQRSSPSVQAEQSLCSRAVPNTHMRIHRQMGYFGLSDKFPLLLPCSAPFWLLPGLSSSLHSPFYPCYCYSRVKLSPGGCDSSRLHASPTEQELGLLNLSHNPVGASVWKSSVQTLLPTKTYAHFRTPSPHLPPTPAAWGSGRHLPPDCSLHRAGELL